jgi:AcrR family transcriptional regulator
VRALPGQAARLAGPQPVTRDGSAADQRRRILLAATDLFAKRGYHGTTIELIVRRAKVGYATFYRQFEDKEACFLALFDETVAAASERIEAAYAASAGEWPDKVAAALAAFFDEVIANTAVARVCLVEALTAGPVAVEHYERTLGAFDPVLRPGREFNPEAATLPETLEETLAGGIFWVAYQRLVIGEADRLRSLLPETIELVLSPYIGEGEAVRVAEESAAAADPRAS